MKRTRLLALPLHALLAGATLSACSQQPPAVPVAPPPPVIVKGECDAQAAQFAVGKVLSGPLTEEARVKAGAERVRTLRPGQMTTMEFDARRLSLDVDAAGKVVAARCG